MARLRFAREERLENRAGDLQGLAEREMTAARHRPRRLAPGRQMAVIAEKTDGAAERGRGASVIRGAGPYDRARRDAARDGAPPASRIDANDGAAMAAR